MISIEPEWHHGSGVPHPTGGYDERFRLLNGVTIYRRHGEFHRTDGPAVMRPRESGQVEWYEHGELHRIDGPAVAWDDGRPGQYWLRGVELLRNEHARAAAAVADGAPIEWALAYANADTTGS